MATEDNEPTGPRRRIVIRAGRRRLGGGSSAGRSDGTPRGYEEDEVDAAVDPAEINRRVREMDRAQATPAPALPAPSAPENYDPNALQQDPFADGAGDPARRMQYVQNSTSPAYAKEYRLEVLHSALMRKVPLDRIARQFGVSISTIEKDRAELKRRLRQKARDLNIDEMVGAQVAFYDDISAQALRTASRQHGPGAVPVPMQLAALRTAVVAAGDKTRFLHTAGVFDVLRFRQAEDANAQSDVQLLMESTDELLNSLVATGGDLPEPTGPTVRRRRRAPVPAPRKGAGFEPFSSTDPEDPEVIEL